MAQALQLMAKGRLPETEDLALRVYDSRICDDWGGLDKVVSVMGKVGGLRSLVRLEQFEQDHRSGPDKRPASDTMLVLSRDRLRMRAGIRIVPPPSQIDWAWYVVLAVSLAVTGWGIWKVASTLLLRRRQGAIG